MPSEIPPRPMPAAAPAAPAPLPPGPDRRRQEAARIEAEESVFTDPFGAFQPSGR